MVFDNESCEECTEYCESSKESSCVLSYSSESSDFIDEKCCMEKFYNYLKLLHEIIEDPLRNNNVSCISYYLSKFIKYSGSQGFVSFY